MKAKIKKINFNREASDMTFSKRYRDYGCSSGVPSASFLYVNMADNGFYDVVFIFVSTDVIASLGSFFQHVRDFPIFPSLLINTDFFSLLGIFMTLSSVSRDPVSRDLIG